MGKKFKRIETNLVHAGEPSPRILGAVATPIFQSAMFESLGEGGYHNLGYIRLNNTPNQKVLHEKLAMLEGAEYALVASSGMAAISTTLLTFLSKGITFSRRTASTEAHTTLSRTTWEDSEFRTTLLTEMILNHGRKNSVPRRKLFTSKL